MNTIKHLISIAALLLLAYACTSPASNVKDLDAVAFKSMLDSSDVILIDARTPEEIQSTGKITGAMNLDYKSDNLEMEAQNIPKGKPLLVYCAFGGRSKKTSNLLGKLGHEEVYNLLGGFNDWENYGFPIEK